VSRIVKKAFLENINTIDTAIGYGDSESILGSSVDLSEWNVVTKLPEIPLLLGDNEIQEWIFIQVKESLQRLKVFQLDAVLLHRPDQLFGANTLQILKGLDQIKLHGLTRKVGVSVYTPQQLQNISNIRVFDLVQLPLNIFDDRFLRLGILSWLKENDVEIHVRSIFLQGLLLMNANERPKKFSNWSDIWRVWDAWLIDNQLTAVEACLQYALSIKEVDRIVIGVNSVNQLDKLIEVEKSRRSFIKPYLPIGDDSPLINPSAWAHL
jgi:aryl-alcohol dehydrogenase-like predicted oxidoreductase